MSKRKRSRSKAPVAKKRKKQSAGFTSLLIPIAVGVVVVAIIIGAIISIENRPAAANVSASVTTAQPRATNPIPYPEVPRVSVKDTKSQLENGQAIVADVRSRNSFDQSHIAGSISIPESEIDARLDELPRDKDVILYCTWGQEQQSARVAQKLMENGFNNVKALLGGYAAWQRAGLPIESSTQ